MTMVWILFCAVGLLVCDAWGGRSLLQDGVVGNNNGSQPVEILVDMRVDGVISIASQKGNGTRTLSGCECIGWTYDGVTSNECRNPNKYSRGNWCVVSRETCTQEPYLGVMRSNDQDVLFNFDICKCAPQESCEYSYNNCPCKQSWIYRGVEVKGCGNPDGGVGGTWCPIDDRNCPHIAQVRKLEDYQGNGLGYWDYCRPGCCST